MTFIMYPARGTGPVIHHRNGSTEGGRSGHLARWLEMSHHYLDRGTLKESSS